MKPMLADDYVEAKLKFPAIVQPKIDGVRAVHMVGKLTGRSLKPFGNKHVNTLFSHSMFHGLDGEMAAASERDPALCRLTTSALGTHEGQPFVLWWLFDYVTPATARIGYGERYELLKARVLELQASRHPAAQQLRVVPQQLVHSLDEFNEFDWWCIDAGYEGTIYRGLGNGYKFGRSTPAEGGLLRVKRFIEEDAVVLSLTEGQTNQNEATINALGQTERSTHMANMVPNGMVGSLECRVVKDVVYRGERIIQEGQVITVAAGSMPHEDRIRFLKHPELIVGKTIKFKTFPKGVKDKPRFPTFQSIRMEEDK